MSSLQKSATQLNLQNSLTIDTQLAFAFCCDPEDILDLFEEITTLLGWQLIERQTTYAMAVRKAQKKHGLMAMINCLTWWQLEGVTAVKIMLSKHVKKGELKDSCVAEVKGMVGMNNHIQMFLGKFAQKIDKFGYGLSSEKVMMDEEVEEVVDPTQNQNPYYLQACSHHLIIKLLLDDKHSISAQLDKTLLDYRNTFKNLQESVCLIPLPMKNTTTIVTDLNQQLQQLLLSLKYPKQFLAYSRISIQNFIFSKLQDHLYSIYRIKNIKTQQIFQQKRQRILQTYSLRQILSQVCLNQKYWSLNQKKLDCILTLQQAKQQIYFSSACRELQKMVFTNSPRQKIKYCQLAYTQLKNHFYDFSKRKYQLASMQDIIPVLIVIVLLLEVGSLRAQLDAMVDFITFDPNEMQAQKRLLINISESYNYIFRDWTLTH